MNIKLFSFFALLFLFSCTTEKDQTVVDPTAPKPGDKTEIETLFDGTKFDNADHDKILKELKICTQEANPDCPRCAVCSPKFFRIHELKKSGNVKDFFGLQIKALTILNGQEFSIPNRHLLIFERENGELVKVNGYRGNLIETIASDSGVDDLMIRFLIKEEDPDSKKMYDVFFHCLFKWDGKRYNYASVEQIFGPWGGGAIKADVKEATSAQVYDDLLDKDLIIKELVSQ